MLHLEKKKFGVIASDSELKISLGLVSFGIPTPHTLIKLHAMLGMYYSLQQQEQIVLERSARLNQDPGRDDLGDGGHG